MNSYRQGLVTTAIPIVGLSLLSTGGVLTNILYFVWLGSALAFVAGLLAAIVVSVVGDQKFAAGMIAGTALGLLALTVTCFANLAIAPYPWCSPEARPCP